MVSPAVVATTITKQGQSGEGELELLVLWRGSPGWFLEGGQDNHGGDITFGGAAAGGPETVVHKVFLGGLELTLRYDRRKRTARVQDIEVSVHNAARNAILVDRVNSDDALTIVGTRWIDPRMSGAPVRIEQVLGRSSELVAFLRCDANLADPLVGEMVQMICRELLNP